jgi:hypothetical protein
VYYTPPDITSAEAYALGVGTQLGRIANMAHGHDNPSQTEEKARKNERYKEKEIEEKKNGGDNIGPSDDPPPSPPTRGAGPDANGIVVS